MQQIDPMQQPMQYTSRSGEGFEDEDEDMFRGTVLNKDVAKEIVDAMGVKGGVLVGHAMAGVKEVLGGSVKEVLGGSVREVLGGSVREVWWHVVGGLVAIIVAVCSCLVWLKHS
jgi:hypothetical protein